ncbi:MULTISPECIES: STN domain-containing protein [unclassified Variovorax]|uniref:STN domain-containing protein n=1 Tax=unclassified Variovorax TaxID=663243 RepID=UPI0013E0A325|nr:MULTISPECIES: STN domain-containing protein [unclassified Variovorax]
MPALQAAPVAQIEFDIAAQRLGDAIDAYSKATRLDILIDGEHAQRSSSAVRGTLTAMEALEAMLAGTGLEARYANAGSIVIRAARTPGVATHAAGVEAMAIEESGFSAGDATHRAYAAQVQDALRGSLCESVQTRPGGYRLALQLRLDPRGAVERFRLLSTTGEPDRDAAVQRKVRDLVVGAPPPPSLPQPLVILLLPEGPDAEPDCGDATRRTTARTP